MEADYLDGKQSVTLKRNRSALKCSKPGSGTASSTMPPFGTMSGHSTAAPGVVVSMLSRLGFLASPSQIQARNRRVMIPETCGLKPFALLKKSGRRSLSWKTCRVSGSNQKATSARSSVIWPRAGMMHDGTAYRLPSLERPTNGKGCGLLPTTAILSLLHYLGYLRKSETWENTGHLANRLIGMAFNLTGRMKPSEKVCCLPDLPEWMMGWPTGWTALEPLATARYRRWSNSFGNSSQKSDEG